MTEQISRRAATLGLAASAIVPSTAFAQNDTTYSEPEIVDAAERFFGAGAEGVAAVVRHVFSDLGRPNGYIEGEEGSGAIGIGLRYGNGHMRLKGRRGTTRVYWRGPSVGFDTGGNAAKVFTLVYGMRNPDNIFERYPGVDGSAYFVGGVGVNYQRRGSITLAPMRAGVGFRLGANIGYLHYSRRRGINPF
ncbi:MAG: DUF1134 domain-containing protein [Hyphomonadaceae bacterium]